MEMIGKEIDPFTGVVEQFYADHNGNYATRNVINNDALIEQNLQERNSGTNGFSKTRNLRKIAEIDIITQMKLLTDHNIDLARWNIDDQTNFKKWLAQSDNAYFRTYNGSI